jgi:3-methylfumaryl-CoA hydratase
MADDLAALMKHIGDTVTDEDVSTAAPIRLLNATFDRNEIEPVPGAAAPEGWHLVYFSAATRPGGLGPDGAAQGLGVIPKMPFPRRMFAGIRMRFHQPIRIGEKLTRETELLSITPKGGSTGRMAITTVISRISGENGLAMEEERDTVFREEIKPGQGNAAPRQAQAPTDTIWRTVMTPNEVALFRFSALTFNPHRIHYDAPYATGVEGYPGLVVHGPFSQTCLINFARDNNQDRQITSFSMRARAPLFVNEPIEFIGRPEGDGCSVWALTPQGGVAMSATATFA